MTSSSTQLSQFSQITITHNDITNEVYRTTVSSVTSVNRHIWPNFYRLLRLVGSQDRTHDRTFRSRSFRSRSWSFWFGLRSSVNYVESCTQVLGVTQTPLPWIWMDCELLICWWVQPCSWEPGILADHQDSLLHLQGTSFSNINPN